MNREVKNEITKLRKNSRSAYVSSVDENGYPAVKGMFILEHDSMKTIYFSTNLSSRRAKHFMSNPKAAVYFCNTEEVKGLLLQGTMEVLTDREHKKMLWRDGFEIYYPKGIDDEDYCVFRFTAEKGNYYHGLNNINFLIDEII